jgi:hypothetical protein
MDAKKRKKLKRIDSQTGGKSGKWRNPLFRQFTPVQNFGFFTATDCN